jgi:hypothetical protein
MLIPDGTIRLRMLKRRYRSLSSATIFVTASALVTACGSSTHGAPPADQDSGGASDEGTGTFDDAGAKCRNTPIVLVDYLKDVPSAGRAAVEIPDLAVNATDLYYISNWTIPPSSGSTGGRDGNLMRVPIRGGTAVRMTAIAGGGSPGVQGLVVTQSAAIFSEAQGADGGAGTIVSVPTDGGNPTVLATANGLAHALVADDQNVYFVDREATKSVPLRGGPVRIVARTVPFSLSVKGGALVLADFTGNTVSSVPVEGGPVTILAKDQPGPLYPLACGPNLCWVNGSASGGDLMQLPPNGTPAVLAAPPSEPHDLAFDGKNFFVTTGGGGLWLYRIPSTGGTPVLAESEPGITNMPLDESCLYWSSLRGISSLARVAADVAGNKP